MRRYKLPLTEGQVAELTHARDHHDKPYVRERAAAILKVWAEQPIKHVARYGLLKQRRQHTVKEWILRYQSQGLPGLGIREGRGRKPLFFPSAGDGRTRSG